jgi:hypothetical protein
MTKLETIAVDQLSSVSGGAKAHTEHLSSLAPKGHHSHHSHKEHDSASAEPSEHHAAKKSNRVASHETTDYGEPRVTLGWGVI